MNLEALPALAGIAFSMTWTPGPNNAMLSASGANYGWQRSMPHAAGVTVGFPVMLVLVALGLIGVLEAFPLVGKILGWIGFALLVWFAWRIATAAAPGTTGFGRGPLTFLEAILFQWVNPKAWALALYITARYAAGDAAFLNTLLAAGVFLVSGLTSSVSWAAAGAGIGKALGRGSRLRWFNYTMALILLVSGTWLMLAG